jgi:hypothetical protein
VLAQERDVLGPAHERQRHEVDADPLADREVREVLLGHGRQLVERPGDVEPLARGDRAADLDLGRDLHRRLAHDLHAQPHGAVGEVHDVAGRQRADQLWARDEHPGSRPEPLVVTAEHDLVAGLELGDVVDEGADPQLRSRQILQHRDRPAGAARRLAHALGGLGVLVGRAVREVQARDVHAGGHHPHERLRLARGRTDRRDDLRVALHGLHGTRASGSSS